MQWSLFAVFKNMARRVVLKPSALPFLIVYIFRREAAWQMCEAPQTGSNAKPDDTFTQVLKRIDGLESEYLEQYSTWLSRLLQRKKPLDKPCEMPFYKLEAGLFEVYNTPDLDYSRLKAYLECKVIEYDTDGIIRMTDIVKTSIEKIIPIAAGAVATIFLFDIDKLLSLFIAGVVCIVLGLKVEIPMKKRHNQKRFYEICLKILEQYIPPKKEVNNSQNLKCIVKINVEQNRKQFGKFKW